MLPHDLPDLMGEDALLHPAVRINPRAGIQPSYFVHTPEGRRFVKVVRPGQSPFVEPAAARIFNHLRVPHIPVSYDFKASRHLNHAPALEGAKTLSQLTPEDVKGIDHDRTARLLFAEWVASVNDRHNGNYLYHPKLGLVSIDHGMSFGPDAWLYHGMAKVPPYDYVSATQDPTASSVNPENSALYAYARSYGGMSPGHKVPEDTVRRAINGAADIGALVDHATVGLPPDSRQAISQAYRTRSEALTSHGTNLTVADLFDLHQTVHENTRKNTNSSR